VIQETGEIVMKPKLRSICIFTALSIAAHGSLYGQSSYWTNVGPLGGSFITMAADPKNPGVIYAGAATGVFKSNRFRAMARDRARFSMPAPISSSRLPAQRLPERSW
jgi:hypothetical protein